MRLCDVGQGGGQQDVLSPGREECRLDYWRVGQRRKGWGHLAQETGPTKDVPVLE